MRGQCALLAGSVGAVEMRALLGQVGVWSRELRDVAPSAAGEAAAELEALGYGGIWIGGSPDVSAARPLVEATSRIVLATGILSIWQHEAAAVAAATAALPADRFVLGLGVSHGPAVPGYRRPYQTMVDYLDALDAAPQPVAPQRRVLAALGPRMLRLSAERAAGAHPYLAPVEHTAAARATLGPGPLLAPEVNVVAEADAATARAVARAHFTRYLPLPNYTNNLRRYGFTDADFARGGSDRLIDSVYLWGTDERIRERVGEHLAAGADHVAIQVIRANPDASPPLPDLRRLAPVLIG